MHSPTKTFSLFIVRIVQEHDMGENTGMRLGWRGVIRHLQSGRELHFLDLNDLAPFIIGCLTADTTPHRPEQDQEQ